ncbi:hypothetical protein GCM10010967_29260 [Dyadobacter beijingensis]|uniref:Outer membrane protein beta-barrel domain-containing protein n=1 Tax=Dyadobacter beijingensis TaxID=365489 RepID=A0ABQ2I0F9_9BACT|nr:hypothetical protein [Dyadobacter beijingensis]GGM94204.1 hypothetical protein GCM10010967_29260 [Dyadobacter beijingensis]
MTCRIIIWASALLLALHVNAQEASTEWFLDANANLHIPGGGSKKSVYPVLAYNKNTDPKFLLGGIGFGAFMLRPLSADFHLKAHGYLSKVSYWDDPVELKSAVGEDVGIFQAGGSDYLAGLNGLIHYHLADHLSLGAGAGLQVLLASFSRTPAIYGYGLPTEKSFISNHHYKTFLPVIPVELSYRFPRTVINLRYDIGVLNRIKGDLGKAKNERFDVLSLEVGFKLK